ncbi:GNAT family N-acetyltransferase [Kitasatospora sp. McL0602]|uniref:GNAT family N-acetyltransferase n=1 Tax=Kitasatospora sp. McL0602 TaxID=3439530 RepID=UPI003F89B307
MIFRPTVESDLDRVLPLIVADPACPLTADTYRARLADGEYRPAWTWIAEDSPGGTPLALAVWWGAPEDSRPSALDALFVLATDGTDTGRIALAAGLLTAAHAEYARAGAAEPPEYHLLLSGGQHDRPDAVAALAWREEAAFRAGLAARVDRVRYEWTPSAGLPAPSGRLLFHPEPDDEVFVDLFRRVLPGTLDAASRKAAERAGVDGAVAQAREDVAFYRDTMLGARSWWRVARRPSGEVVGFGLPSRNHAFPVVGYLGVLPGHRGCGYADEILAEITRVLVSAADPERVRADTDLTNTPMRAAFERVGYRADAHRVVLSAD